MMKCAFLLSLAVLALTILSANGATVWPDAPYGSIVAVARLTPVDKSLVVRGSVALVWPRVGRGNASVSVNLTGSLSLITEAHIFQNTTRSPIRLDLLPVVANGTRPAPLSPPMSFRGTLSFQVPFDYRRVAAWDADNNFMNTVELLQQGRLYVGVRTSARPGGALLGKLQCKEPCMFAVCNAYPGHQC